MASARGHRVGATAKRRRQRQSVFIQSPKVIPPSIPGPKRLRKASRQLCVMEAPLDLRDRLSPAATLQFYSPRFLFVELFKHKHRLTLATRLNEDELLEALHTLVSRLDFVNEANIPIGTWMEAHRLCRDVDEKDTPYIALTLHLDGQFSSDNPLERCRFSGGTSIWRCPSQWF